jgi:vancomycin resistance protein VanJ
VMGDFNAPIESVWLDRFRSEFREAFLTAGAGYAPTWPDPAPVLKLDQIWLNRRLDVRRAWQTRTWRSDHRMQWAEIVVR